MAKFKSGGCTSGNAKQINREEINKHLSELCSDIIPDDYQPPCFPFPPGMENKIRLIGPPVYDVEKHVWSQQYEIIKIDL